MNLIFSTKCLWISAWSFRCFCTKVYVHFQTKGESVHKPPWDLAVFESATWRQLGDNMGQVWDNLGLVWDYLGLVWDYLRLFSDYIGAKKSQCTNHLEIYRAQSRQHLSFERRIFFKMFQYSVFRWWVPVDMPTTVAFGVKVFQFV